MPTPLTVSEQRALGRMGAQWVANNVRDGNDGAWRDVPEYRKAVSAVETAADRAARETTELTERHAQERADLQARHGGRS